MSYLSDKIEVVIEEKELQAKGALDKIPGPARWFIIIGTIAIIPSYFISKSVSRTYWDKHYASSLISAKPSFENPKDLQFGQSVITSAAENTYAVAVEVKNENLDLSLRNTPITITLQNDKGENVYTAKEKLFIYPDQKKYIVLPKVTSTEKVAKVSVGVPEDLTWQKRISIPKVELEAPAPKMYNQSGPQAFVLEGYFQNNSPYAIKQVRLNFLLFNGQGAIIAVTQRTEFTIKPFERRAYKILWPNVYGEDVDVASVMPETDVFEEGNLSLPDIQNNSSGNLGRESDK